MGTQFLLQVAAGQQFLILAVDLSLEEEWSDVELYMCDGRVHCRVGSAEDGGVHDVVAAWGYLPGGVNDKFEAFVPITIEVFAKRWLDIGNSHHTLGDEELHELLDEYGLTEYETPF